MMYARVLAVTRMYVSTCVRAADKSSEKGKGRAEVRALRKTPMSRYACNARIMSTGPIKSGTSARTKPDKGEGEAAETYVSTGRRGRDCSRNRFDV